MRRVQCITILLCLITLACRQRDSPKAEQNPAYTVRPGMTGVWVHEWPAAIPGSIVFHYYNLHFEWGIGNFCWIHKRNCSLERFKPTGRGTR